MPVIRPALFASLIAPVAATALLAACTPPAKQPVLNIHGAQTTLPAVKGNPGAVYFRINGGPEDVKLLAVLSPDTQRIELHESVSENGLVKMNKLQSVDVPAKGTVEFKQGGKHVMVWGINDAAIQRGTFPITFVFSNKDRIVADVKINPAPTAGNAAADAAKDDHAGHDMAGMDMGKDAAPKADIKADNKAAE